MNKSKHNLRQARTGEISRFQTVDSTKIRKPFDSNYIVGKHSDEIRPHWLNTKRI